MMNAFDFQIIGLHTKIEKNRKVSRNLKILAGSCWFFAFFYCFGTRTIENMGYMDSEQKVLTNLVWLFSMIFLIGFYWKDSACIKNSKACELEIYRLEVEDLKNKKEVAKIKEEVLPDYMINKQIDMPDEKVSLPTIYYGILLGIHVIVRVYLGVNHIL